MDKYSSALKTETVWLSETSITTYERGVTTQKTSTDKVGYGSHKRRMYNSDYKYVLLSIT